MSSRLHDLRHLLWPLVLALFVLDCVLWACFALSPRRRLAMPSLLVCLTLTGICLILPGTATATAPLTDRLAYWKTGDEAVDEASRLGLLALGKVLQQRTSIDLASPLALTPASPDWTLYPLLYWPYTPNQPPLPEAATTKLRHYLAHQGMLFLDLRLGSTNRPVPEVEAWAATLLRTAGITRLTPLPENHVLGRSYYVLTKFPGRWAGGGLHISPPDNASDNVPTVVIGRNDYAAAWATVENANTPLHQPVPDGPWQREMAYRTGVNLVAYALTGNYKDDQIHLEALLQRLGKGN